MSNSRTSPEEKLYFASQWQLMWRKFRKHRLAIFGTVILAILYTLGMFCEFFATYDPQKRHPDFPDAPPQQIHFFHEGTFSLRPFVYGYAVEFDMDKFVNVYVADPTQRSPIYFFVRGDEYKLWGLFRSNLHLLGVKEGTFFPFGTDELGKDLFSQTLTGARVSLSIGLVGVALSFILGCILGGISGYFGGAPDMIIQRAIEFLISLPTIPLWLALAAALPPQWESIKVYFGITLILSIVGWCGVARVVRGKLLELRGEDFVLAARLSGLSQGRIIARHLLPSFMSYLIVHLTLAIPNMILAETALSFLGLGIRPPAISWGALLHTAKNVRTITMHPWLLIPGIFVIITVLAFNFLGDGLRDAADPYK